MAPGEASDETIAAAMAKTERRICVGSDRCFAFPDPLADAN
jgi:hypothetical protein